MKEYSLWRLDACNDYGQPIARDIKQKVKIAINLVSQSISDNIIYKDAQFIGLTHSALTDKDIIIFNGEKLKVVYVNNFGRLNQVFMVAMPNG